MEIIIDDPGATDPDESTIGLQVLGETVPRVHLSDGLWYQYTAEEDFFGIYLDLLTDGARDSNIAVVSVTPTPASVMIGAKNFTFSTDPFSWVREVTVGPGGFRFIEV